MGQCQKLKNKYSMKRFLIIFSILIAGAALYAQGPRSAIYGVTGSSTINGAVAVNIDLPQYLFQEYDYSYQVIPALSLAGDSLNAVVELLQTNSMAASTYTEITSAQDTVIAAAGKLIEGTNATGLKHRLTITGISADTMTVTVAWVLKLDKPFR